MDELANAQTTGNGRPEMFACERVFRQATWLWGQIWPKVDGLGEEDELAAEQSNMFPTQAWNEDTVMGNADPNSAANGTEAEKPIEIDDEDAEGTMDSPHGGPGLGAVTASNTAR